MRNILVIDKDGKTAEGFRHFLDSYDVTVYRTALLEEALDLLVKIELNLLVFDAELSKQDNYTLLKAVQEIQKIPVLVLSTRSNEKERLELLKAGAHAYLRAPYSIEECLFQAYNLMEMYPKHFSRQKASPQLSFGKNLIIDSVSRRVFLKGQELSLTRKEFDILYCLARHPGQVFSRGQLYSYIWEEDTGYNIDEIVKAHIKTLRKKLSVSDREYIENVWGVGYRFAAKKDGEP